jgi:hypothetical protein
LLTTDLYRSPLEAVPVMRSRDGSLKGFERVDTWE